jgi:hypothetical protein
MRKDGIPAQLKMMGHTITVAILPPSKWRYSKKYCGNFDPSRNRIELLSGGPTTQLQATFCHELTHAMFTYAGRQDLSDDETLVDKIGELLAQALATFE